MATALDSPRRVIVPVLVLWAGALLACGVACNGGASNEPESGGNPDVDPDPAAEDNRVARALPLFMEGKEGPFPAPSARMQRARTALANRDGKTARLLLEEDVAENPSNGEATLILAEMLMNKGQFGAARDGIERILEQGPTFPRCEQAFLLYARCLLRLGEGKGARAALEAYEQLSPEDGDTQWVFGMLDVQEGRSEDALLHFDRALEIYREMGRPPLERARIHSGRADAYLQQGELEKARASLLVCTRINPFDPQAQYALSRVLTRLGDTEGAERAMQAFGRAKAAGTGGAAGRPPGNSRDRDGNRTP